MKIDYKKATFAVIILAIIVRLVLFSIYTVSGDACWHLSVSKFISEEKNIPFDEPLGRDEPFWAPPLFHIITALFYGVLGEAGMKLIPVVFGSLTLILSYKILRKYLSEEATFFGTFFMAVVPIFIDYSVLGYVESTLTFFVTLSLYLALNNRFIASGVVAGLAILTKYNGGLIVPVLLFIIWKKKKHFLKNAAAITIVPGIVGLPWFLRNWVLFGNPIWPFLNFVFGGLEKASYSGLQLRSLISPETYIATYLGFFGVPNGNYHLLFFIDHPLVLPAIILFLIGTAIFLIPFLFSFTKKKSHQPFYILLASFILLFILYVVNVGPFVSRMLLPALVGFGLLYGYGFERTLKKLKNLSTYFIILILLISLGFVAVEVTKFHIAKKSWDFYQNDFNWVKENTPENSVFLLSGQCVQYHIDRTGIFANRINSDEYEYVWVNQDFILDRVSILSDDNYQAVQEKNLELEYENSKTKTKIYSIN